MEGLLRALHANEECELIDKTTITIPRYPERSLPLSRRKCHELSQLLPHVEKIITENQVEFVIDVGSGNGYLSRYLAIKGFNVVCIEKNSADTSRRLDGVYGIKSFYLNGLEELHNQRFTTHIKSLQSSNQARPKGFIVGLDICGDLANDVLRELNREHCVDLIGCCLVPCCVHKMTYLLTLQDDRVLGAFKGCLEQDLRALTELEILKKFSEEGRDFSRWESENFKTNLLELIAFQDRLDYLENYQQKSLDVVFDFSISSRNIALTIKR